MNTAFIKALQIYKGLLVGIGLSLDTVCRVHARVWVTRSVLKPQVGVFERIQGGALGHVGGDVETCYAQLLSAHQKQRRM